MKKKSNNLKSANIALILNILIFAVFVVFLCTLHVFDKANVEYQRFFSTYTSASDALLIAQQSARQESSYVAQYQYYVNVMSTKPISAFRKESEAYNAELTHLTKLLSEKIAVKNSNDSIVALKKSIFTSIESEYHRLEDVRMNNKTTCSVWIIVLIVLIVSKIAVWAKWTYKNAKNVRNAATWASKSSKLFWAWLAWIIPILNIFKPYAFFSELWDDTDYLLKDRNILPPTDKKGEYTNDLYIGLWWGLFLCSMIGVSIFLNYTFFYTSIFYSKLNHLNVIIVSAICWALYLTIECVIIYKYNLLNKLMSENL